MDVFVVTEAWLTLKDRDKVWMEASQLNRNNDRLMTVNRTTKGRGGDLAVVYNSDLDIKLLSSSERNTFKFSIWRVETENRTIIIVEVYHKPASEIIPHSNNQFIDDFLSFCGSISVEYKNIITLGDVNMHVKDNDDEDGLQISDMIEALGLTQWMNFPTHNKGSTLDLHVILTGTVSDFSIISVNQEKFFIGTLYSDYISGLL